MTGYDLGQNGIGSLRFIIDIIMMLTDFSGNNCPRISTRNDGVLEVLPTASIKKLFEPAPRISNTNSADQM
jgi:hypothetical protein